MVVSSLLKPFVLFTKYQHENSPLGTSQWTRKVKKTLQLTIQMIAKAVADVKNLQASLCVNLQKGAGTAHSCGHMICTAAEL